MKLSRSIVYLGNIFYLFYIRRFDYEKFVTALNELEQGLQKQMNLWYQYELSLQQVVSWLNDVESALRNYTEQNTLEEKQEQLNNYMVSISESWYFMSIREVGF